MKASCQESVPSDWHRQHAVHQDWHYCISSFLSQLTLTLPHLFLSLSLTALHHCLALMLPLPVCVVCVCVVCVCMCVCVCATETLKQLITLVSRCVKTAAHLRGQRTEELQYGLLLKAGGLREHAGLSGNKKSQPPEAGQVPRLQGGGVAAGGIASYLRCTYLRRARWSSCKRVNPCTTKGHSATSQCLLVATDKAYLELALKRVHLLACVCVCVFTKEELVT